MTRITYICPFCHKRTRAVYDTFLKQGKDGAEYSCVCNHCLNICIVVVQPTELFFLKLLNKLTELFKN